jgi:predicted flap endonuclease-1-like 5' DNA nuclease
MNMRLDYALYVLAAVLLIITVVPFVAPVGMETIETKSIWVVASVVLGLFSIGLGYSQRPKTEAQACQPAMPVHQETISGTQPATTMEAPKEEKTEAPMEKPAMQTAPAKATSTAATLDLTQVKGIGEKRATQLKALGINSVDDLAKASAKTVAKKLKISPKTVNKWVASAKQLVE